MSHDEGSKDDPKNGTSKKQDSQANTAEKKDGIPITRRDFAAASFGAAMGFALFGLRQSKQAKNSDESQAAASGSGPKGDRTIAFQKHNEKPGGLATPHEELKESYEVLIIGSGYGGSVLAARLAKPGRSVALLERGKEWLPGDFPTNLFQLSHATRHPTMNPLGLFEFNSPLNSDVDVITGCGLGGTSLINAAICSRPLDNVFEQKEWPDEIKRAKRDGTLDAYYDKAEKILAPMVAPNAEDMAKVQLHADTLAELGIPADRLRLAINHGAPNPHGASQKACTSCGDCCGGCNIGAKNTLQMNYLPIAKRRSAQIFVGMEVRWIEKLSNGRWRVHYTYHAGGISLPKKGKIDAKLVVVSAGSQGSTEILMRSQDNNLSLSSTLGTRMSANGDVLGFSYNGSRQTNILGYGNTVNGVRAGWPVGQALMAYGDYRKADPTGDIRKQFLLIEGTVPTALTSEFARALAVWARTNWESFDETQKKRIEADFMSTSSPPQDGALNHSMVMLACGHDSSGGRYVYNGKGRPWVEWPSIRPVASESDSSKKVTRGEPSFDYIHDVMEQHANSHGAKWIPNPRATIYDKRLAATHPLGGCPMGQDASHGVVDHAGRVFDGHGGIHAGLYVADASILPRSLAATPLMTISALSERIADIILSTVLKA